jgi:hypothetical protein
MTIDRPPFDRVLPATRFGSTANVVGGSAMVALGLANNWWLWTGVVSLVTAAFIVLSVRAWRGDYDNITSWEALKNPLGSARPRIPGAGIRPSQRED